MDERLIGRHPPRTVDDVDAPTPAPSGGGAASAASVIARPRRRRAPAPTARQLYNFALTGFTLLAFGALMSGNFWVGGIFFVLLFLFVKLSRLGD